MLALTKKTGYGLIAMTHLAKLENGRLASAREIADHVYFTDHGVIVEDGPPEALFGNPRKDRTRAFLEQIL